MSAPFNKHGDYKSLNQVSHVTNVKIDGDGILNVNDAFIVDLNAVLDTASTISLHLTQALKNTTTLEDGIKRAQQEKETAERQQRECQEREATARVTAKQNDELQEKAKRATAEIEQELDNTKRNLKHIREQLQTCLDGKDTESQLVKLQRDKQKEYETSLKSWRVKLYLLFHWLVIECPDISMTFEQFINNTFATIDGSTWTITDRQQKQMTGIMHGIVMGTPIASHQQSVREQKQLLIKNQKLLAVVTNNHTDASETAESMKKQIIDAGEAIRTLQNRIVMAFLAAVAGNLLEIKSFPEQFLQEAFIQTPRTILKLVVQSMIAKYKHDQRNGIPLLTTAAFDKKLNELQKMQQFQDLDLKQLSDNIKSNIQEEMVKHGLVQSQTPIKSYSWN